jgi:hypothetical protein
MELAAALIFDSQRGGLRALTHHFTAPAGALRVE